MNIPLPRPLSVAEVDKAEVQVMENGTKIDDDHSKIGVINHVIHSCALHF